MIGHCRGITSRLDDQSVIIPGPIYYHSLKNEGIIRHGIFSLSFKDDESVLELGSADFSTNAKSLNRAVLKASNSLFWTSYVSSVMVDKTSLRSFLAAPLKVVFDSSTPLIYTPISLNT